MNLLLHHLSYFTVSDFVFSYILYIWELILMVPTPLPLISKLLPILIIIYWLQSWGGIKIIFLTSKLIYMSTFFTNIINNIYNYKKKLEITILNNWLYMLLSLTCCLHVLILHHLHYVLQKLNLFSFLFSWLKYNMKVKVNLSYKLI